MNDDAIDTKQKNRIVVRLERSEYQNATLRSDGYLSVAVTDNQASKLVDALKDNSGEYTARYSDEDIYECESCDVQVVILEPAGNVNVTPRCNECHGDMYNTVANDE